MPETIPLSISRETADYIAEIGMHQPFQKMLDNIPLRIPGVRAIVVYLQDPYDTGGGPSVILDVKRDVATQEYDPTEWNWRLWVIDNFPPKEFQHFCLLSNIGPTDAG